MEDEIYPQIPVDFLALKEACRMGLKTSSSRAYWWPVLPTIFSQSGSQTTNTNSHSPPSIVETYPDVTNNAERLKDLINEPLIDNEYQKLTESDDPLVNIDTGAKNLIVAFKRQFKNKELNNLETLSRILLRDIKRFDVTYMVLSDLISNNERYLDTTVAGHTNRLFAFKELLQGYLPKTFIALNVLGALDDKYLNLIFVDFFVEILPERFVSAIIDAFLLEGVKVLHRYGLALIKGYKSQIKANKYQTAKDFWISIKADAIFQSSTYNHPMLYKLINQEESLPPLDPFLVYSNANNKPFMQSNLIRDLAFETNRSLFDKALRPMNISTNTLSKLKINAENNLQTNSNDINHTHNNDHNSNNESTPQRKQSLIQENAFNNRQSIHSKSTARKSLSRNSPSNNSNNNNDNDNNSEKAIENDELVPNETVSSPIKQIPLEQFQQNVMQTLKAFSSILTNSQMNQLVLWLPDTLLHEGLQLLFATHRDGFDISSLYGNANGYTKTIILIQLTAPCEHVLLGAYLCGVPLASRGGGQVVGNGDSFVFRLDEGHEKKYPWVNKINSIDGNDDDDNNNNNMKSDNNVENNGVLQAAINQFAYVTPSYFSFGGSSREGSNAIRVDGDLRTLTTGHSDTYDNPPLIGTDNNNNNDNSYNQFSIKEIEVFGNKRGGGKH
eukprot:gene14771-19852_t